jgi:ApbE superfamily uncharacterized protein (UPF0280 family)
MAAEQPTVYRHRGAVFRLVTQHYGLVTAAIRRHRRLLEAYLRRHPAFGEAFEPVAAHPDAPACARHMAAAAAAAGVGPMAAVAGAMAQLAADAARLAGERHTIVDNGGDLFLACDRPARVRLDAGASPVGDRLAFAVQPSETPLAICSSSGTMGHSTSLGRCDLATVTAADAALADAAATLAANLVREPADVDSALERVMAVSGVRGVLIVKDDRVGLAGRLPRLVR